jgi:hypothetical protein
MALPSLCPQCRTIIAIDNICGYWCLHHRNTDLNTEGGSRAHCVKCCSCPQNPEFVGKRIADVKASAVAKRTYVTDTCVQCKLSRETVGYQYCEKHAKDIKSLQDHCKHVGIRMCGDCKLAFVNDSDPRELDAGYCEHCPREHPPSGEALFSGRRGKGNCGLCWRCCDKHQ